MKIWTEWVCSGLYGRYRLLVCADNEGNVRDVVYPDGADPEAVEKVLLQAWGTWEHEIRFASVSDKLSELEQMLAALKVFMQEG
ncbi:hypothetical protein [Candidatus Pyrohabitans sp.]